MTKKPKHQQKSLPKHYHAMTNHSYQPDKPHDARPKAPEEPKKSRWKRFPWKRTILVVVILLLLPFLVIGVWDWRNFTKASDKLFASASIFDLMSSTPLKQTAAGRTNLMLIGYSVDDPGHAGAMLTDSILIVSLDHAKHTGYMLSIPRDLYVEIPNYGSAKINEAYQAGEAMKFKQSGYSRGGPGMLESIIDKTFGIDVHYHAIINYGAVKEIVDALGGITVTIKSDDPRGIFDPNFPKAQGGPLRLKNGKQKINGQTALRLTRARGATYGSYGFPLSDFNRTQNQQQVFAAIQRELNWQLVLDPRTNGKIFEAAADNVKTDLKLSELIPMYRLFVSVPEGSLKPINLRELNGVNLLTGFTTSTGQSALIPSAGINDYSQIKAHIKKLSK